MADDNTPCHVTPADWPFADPVNCAVITTSHVLEGHPVLLVCHDDDDGAWQFLCGTTSEITDGRIVGLGEIIKRHPSLGELADLPFGWQAWRETADAPWQKAPHEPEEE